MKKLLLVVLALCLCCSVAAAETSIAVKTMDADRLEMNETANTFIYRDSSRLYQVVDAELNPLSEAYSDIDESYGLYKVTNKNNGKGLLDGQGRLLVPAEYDDIKIISDRWAAGVRLVEATSENYDYETWFSSEKKFFLIDTVDIYFQGEKKGTFSRMDWKDANAYGDYLCIRNRDGKRFFYDRDLKLSEAEAEYGSEYNEDYRTGKVIHMGSGQEAFTDGCTLTPDEVQQSVWIKKDMLTDLQGNVLADLSDYYSTSVDSSSNLIRTRNKKGLYGLLDSEGREIIPCRYESLGYDFESALTTGYLYAVLDGKAGFVKLADASETGFEFIESAGRQIGSFIVIEDPREGTILISAMAGELAARYQDVNVPYSTAPYATVQDTDGHIHVIGQLGEEMLPDNPDITSKYNVTYSKDGTMILVQTASRDFHLYQIEYDPQQPVAEQPEPSSENPDGWICAACGAENAGKFCTNCGAPKPVEEEPDLSWTCENGHEGNTGNFCSECGAPRPAN